MGSQKLAFRLGTAGVVVVVLIATSYFAALGATTGWPTYQHDAVRTGVDPDAPPVAAVTASWNTQLDAKMYAQPLVAGSLVYAATENNTVYALDVTSGAIAWSQHVATPARLSQLPCGNIDPYGITSTPVIDTANGVLYTVALLASATIHHELYALNLNAGGTVLYHYQIDAPGSDPSAQGQRGALTLANGKVYVPFAGRYGDCGNYKGRVVGVNAGDTTGASLVSYGLPNTSAGGIWAAASSDASGNLYVASGNSGATGTTPDRGESVVKLSPTLQELDFFTAPEWSNLNATDTDIGSIGPILLQNGWILQSGKNGMGYLLNSTNLGRVGGQLFEARICDPGQEAVAFGAYLAPDTVFIPCSSALKAVRVNTSGTPSFTVTTVRGGYSGGTGASPPIIAGGVLWNLDPGSRLLLGFNPSTSQQLFTLALAGTPANFVAPSSGAGHVFAPSGSILEAFSISSGGPTPTSTSTRTPTSTPTSTPTPQQASYSSQATGSPNPVSRGTTLSIVSSVTDSQSANVLIVVKVFDPASNLVFHEYWDNQPLVAGQPRTFPSSWNVPASAATGTYTMSIGVYAAGFGPQKYLNGAAGSFSVVAAGASTATPTPTPLPTRTPTPTATPTPQQATYTTGATVSPNPVSRGRTLSIQTIVTASQSGNVLIVVYVYDPTGNLAFHEYWDNQAFVAGQQRNFPASWTVPGSAATGTYTTKIGVYAPNFGALKSWNGNAATFGVN